MHIRAGTSRAIGELALVMSLAGCVVPYPVTYRFYVPSGDGVVGGEEPNLDFRYAALPAILLAARPFRETQLLIRVSPVPGTALRFESEHAVLKPCQSTARTSVSLPDIPVAPGKSMPATALLSGSPSTHYDPRFPETKYHVYSIDLPVPGHPDCFTVELPRVVTSSGAVALAPVKFAAITKTIYEVGSPGK